MVPPGDATYFDFASELVHDQPAEALAPEIAGALATVGIVRDRPFRPDTRTREILAEAARVGNATARTLACRPRPAEGAHYYGPSSRWLNGLLVSGHDFTAPAAVSAADGTTTLHFGPDRPGGVPEGNWIQTLPDRGWFVVLRFYNPLRPFFDRTWRPGEIEPV
ncbi:DUF1214 domain-containing protein [Streptomyces verrucosisporus]|uniref:DUF1214 domain-containing protein n=1 Tax=Streptomyces verrucosisporus TaxID=1695161 RepID=UPI001F125572|nr:DUF1214 domain-containing protein [Streptomyces verrucosisporus]